MFAVDSLLIIEILFQFQRYKQRCGNGPVSRKC